jgi:N-acetylneuraminate synthase
LGGRAIGDGTPCFVIAEAGLNHNGDLHIAKLLIDVAVLAGADAVKFQKRDLASLYQKETLADESKNEQQFQYLLPTLRRCEMGNDDFREIKAYCDEHRIMFLCSVWDRPSADFIDTLAVPGFKVASADMTNFPLLEHLISKKKPLIISTGMSSPEEVDKTVEFLRARDASFALLHTSSTYPAPYGELNLRYMVEMKRMYGVPVGYSGHERGIAVPLAAVALGASVIEKHLTLDRTMKGPDHPASLEPEEFIRMVKEIRIVEESLGSPRRWLTRGEYMNREVLGKSLVAAREIRKGEKITRDMVTAKSPGKGVSPQRLEELVGTVAARDISAEDFFLESDIRSAENQKALSLFRKKWGVIVRFSDIAEFVKYGPYLVEFHMTERDLEAPQVAGRFSQQMAIHVPEYCGENLVDLCSRDERLRRQSVERVRQVMNIARELAPRFSAETKPRMILHPGGMSFERESPAVAAEMLANLKRSLGEIDTREVELLIENMPPSPWYFGGQWYHNVFIEASEMADFCAGTKSGMCFDVSHAKLAANYLHADFEEYVRTLLPHVRYIHVADAAGVSGEGLQIGDGEIDFESLWRLIGGLDVVFVPEIWQGHKFGGEGFLAALRRLGEIAARVENARSDG